MGLLAERGITLTDLSSKRCGPLNPSGQAVSMAAGNEDLLAAAAEVESMRRQQPNWPTASFFQAFPEPGGIVRDYHPFSTRSGSTRTPPVRILQPVVRRDPKQQPGAEFRPKSLATGRPWASAVAAARIQPVTPLTFIMAGRSWRSPRELRAV